MVKHFNIKGLNLIFVLKHKWEKKDRYMNAVEFRKYELGLFFSNTKSVGRNNFKNVREWKNNMCNSYMIGLNLLVCKCWMTIDYNVMHFKE